MGTDYRKVHRLLRIVTLVQGGGHWRPKDLAVACGTTERSVFRDLKDLAKAGIPLVYNAKDKTYTAPANVYLPPVQLTVEEALSIIALGDSVGAAEQVPHLRPAKSASEKLKAQLGVDVRTKVGRAQERVSIKLAASSPPESTASDFAKVLHAIETQTMLDVAYDSSKTKAAKSTLHPYELMFNQRAWYVIGLSERHGEVRTFKLSRFVKLSNTSEKFFIPKGWSLEKHLGYAWRMIRGKPRQMVELIFTPEFGETVTETRWHKTQESEELEDGSVRLKFEVDGLEEIVWWVLGMGPNCRVMHPPELAQKVKALAAQTAKLYGE